MAAAEIKEMLKTVKTQRQQFILSKVISLATSIEQKLGTLKSEDRPTETATPEGTQFV